MTTLKPLPSSRTVAAAAAPVLAEATPPTAVVVPSIRRELRKDGTCVLTFDCPGMSANVLNTAVLNELDEHISVLEVHEEIRLVILRSAKPSIFIAGADLRALSGWIDAQAEIPSPGLSHLITLGQRVIQRLANLPMTTVALVHGACIGGGMEIALACDYRLASTDKSTRLGLPETRLGILPAWGGCTRLPKLVGLLSAVDLILKGRMLAPRPALKLGLVDAIAPMERLPEMAMHYAGHGKRKPSLPLKASLATNSPAAFMMLPLLRERIARESHGHYPALPAALEVLCRGVGDTEDSSLQREHDAILKLAKTDACHQLLRLHFLQERAKKLGADSAFSLRPAPLSKDGKSPHLNAPKPQPVARTAVIGAGVMGAGIAGWMASRRLPVVLRDVSPEHVARGLTSMQRNFDEAVRRHQMTPVEARSSMDRIYPAYGRTPLQNADIVIEAAVEKMELKQDLFRRLANETGPETILATNTSALSITAIAAATAAPHRVVGIHFFNPVHRMQLVEVIVGRETDPAVLERAVRFVQQIGKLPVVVNDSPGFLVNRILMPYLMEAVSLFANGAEVADIDNAMLDFGMPMGPLRLLDEVGLDVARHVAGTLAHHFKDRMEMPAMIDRMVEGDLLGRKSKDKHGFYRHYLETPQPNDGVKAFQHRDSAADLTVECLQRRMVLPMINEAARCLEEEVVQAPEDVDFAMVMGTGFAPFRGGPLRYADTLGTDLVLRELLHEVEGGARHFEPCGLLRRKWTDNETFYPRNGGTS